MNNQWGKCLSDSLLYLQSSWHNKWLGLDEIVLLITDFLERQNKNVSQMSSQAHLMLDIAHHVACLIEAEARCNPQQVDHPYHNRLHFAQVMVSVAIQSVIQSHVVPDDHLEWASCLLLCATAHDYKHTGQINQKPQEIELQTVDALMPILFQFGLNGHWKETIQTIILNTDVPTSKGVFSRVKDTLFSWNCDWASVLLIESDNMSSCHPLLGPGLSQDLSREWLKLDNPPDRHVASMEGRQRYLNGVTFTSLSSEIVGIKKLIQQQLVRNAPMPNK